jgi:hypothetical protein
MTARLVVDEGFSWCDVEYRRAVDEDADKPVRELVNGLGLEEQRVDVVVLDKVTCTEADDVQ